VKRQQLRRGGDARIQRIFFVFVREQSLPPGSNQEADQGLCMGQVSGVCGDPHPRGIENHPHALISLIGELHGNGGLRVFGQVASNVIMIDQAGSDLPTRHGRHNLPAFPVHE